MPPRFSFLNETTGDDDEDVLPLQMTTSSCSFSVLLWNVTVLLVVSPALRSGARMVVSCSSLA